jgi:hypothetical protein
MYRATANYSKQQFQFISNHLLALSPNSVYSVDVSFIGDTMTADRANELWHLRVFTPLTLAVQAFLDSRPILCQTINSGDDELNAEVIAGLVAHESDGNRQKMEKMEKKHCDECNLTLMGEIQWQSHIRSKKHQKRKKGNLKRRNFVQWQENESQKKFKSETLEDERESQDY